MDRIEYDVTGDDMVTVQEGTDPSATREFDTGSVAAGGGPVVATITVSGATQAVVTETLPTGFAYVSSSLPDSQVRPDPNDSQRIRFVLADSADNPFTYTVTVSEAGSISGKLTVDRIEYDVTGDDRVTVRTAPSTGGGGGGGGGVTPANRAPVFSEGASAARSVAENSAAGTAVGRRVTAVDPDGSRVTYSLVGGDTELFNIDLATGQISVAQGTSLDFEAKDSYIVSVRARDPSGSRDTISMTINVTNVDEDGAVTLSPEQPKIGTELTAALTDADGGVSDANWRWERSQDNMTWTAISGATSNTYTPVEADEGNHLRATVEYTDGHGSGKRAQLAFADPVPLMPTPVPTPTPQAAATPTPQPAATATPQPTATPTPVPTATLQPTPTAPPVPGHPG